MEHVTHITWLEDLRKSSSLYYAKRIANTKEDKDTEATVFGRAFHAALLQPDLLAEKVAIGLGIDRRSNKNKEKWAKFEAENAGKSIISAKEMATIDAMVQAVHDHDFVGPVLAAAAACEKTIVWKHPATGIQVSSRIDIVALSIRSLGDVKTCENNTPKAWARATDRYGYHRQAAGYLLGWQILTGEQLSFVDIMVPKEFPHIPAAYELSDDAIDAGMQDNERSFAQLARCLETGDWRAPHEKGCHLVSPFPSTCSDSVVWEVAS